MSRPPCNDSKGDPTALIRGEILLLRTRGYSLNLLLVSLELTSDQGEVFIQQGNKILYKENTKMVFNKKRTDDLQTGN